MISKKLLKKIRRIQITTSRMVTDVFAGEYKSIFKGRGMEFHEVREYNPGDEIRFIDWNVTARMGNPYVKKFVEERELTVILLLDVSGSCSFGTKSRLKSQLAAEICSVLAFSAIKNNDRVGLIAFTDRVEKFVPPRKGVRHVLRVIREALYYSQDRFEGRPGGKSKGTDIASALEYLSKVTARSTISFVISDFYSKDFSKQLSIANKRHDVIAVTITDPRESELPNVGIIKLHDPETGESRLLDTASAGVTERYRQNSLERFKKRKELFRSTGVDHVDIFTDLPYADELIKFFKLRERRFRQR
jgi:uncharacterized protein (DUF58 family)